MAYGAWMNSSTLLSKQAYTSLLDQGHTSTQKLQQRGIPGWVLRKNATIRSDDPEYLNTTIDYMNTLGRIIEKAQITHGGPVTLVQPENEYSTWPGVTSFPSSMNRRYMDFVEKQLLEAGITVPLIVNDNLAMGYWAPGSGLGAVDIYGIDSYPLSYDCAHPTIWPTYRFPYDWQVVHERESPSTPFAIAELQGGSGQGWGGVVQDKCGELVNAEAARVVYKNNHSFGVKIFNIYMTYGGTNWGNLGYHGGYTSYDYGAAITEERGIWREKYSEQKMEANFLKVSPAYLTATSKLGVNGSYGAPASIAVTPLVGNGTRTNFYVVRHANFSSLDKTQYSLTVYTSVGNVSIPQLGSSLTFNGRDSKFHVTDYDLDGINLIYSTAEIFTWARGLGSSRVLVLYGGAGETHEFALSRHLGNPAIIEGDNVSFHPKDLMWVVRWQVGPDRSVIRVSNLEIYLVWRNEAYNYWALELPASHPIGNFSSPSKDRVIVKAGYLVRSAKLVNKQLWLSGDVNTTTNIEVISTPVGQLEGLVFNGQQMKTSRTTTTGKLSTIIEYQPPTLDIPDFTNLRWKYRDSLPEINSSYDDSAWQSCDKPLTHNPRNLDTPMVLYAMDYGFHTGSLLYRGHFSANGHESYIWLNTSGGIGFGHSVWLDDTFLGSWPGTGANATITQNFTIPTALSSGTQHILSVLIDNMGQDEEAPGTDAIKFPHVILGYQLSNHAQSDVSWKVTGNFGGEQYRDLARGPLNEGAIPFKTGLLKAGVGFYTTSFRLNIPDGWDVPFSIVFNNSTAGDPSQKTSGLNYRCQLYVNGYQYGKYINNLGPQNSFPIPEGILNHNGINYIALTLWAQDPQGARLGGLDLVPSMLIRSDYVKPRPAPQPAWETRSGAC
ncbi:hypothetical protein PoHVEF18_006428 [Penicillium ochrochloron]